MSDTAERKRRAAKRPPIRMTKVAKDLFRPATEEDLERLGRFRTGATIACDVREERNYKFLQKYMVMVKFLFDIWEETMPRQQWRGQEVRANIDRFRGDLTILTGRCDATYNVRGEVRLEPHSVSFASMGEEEFEQLFSETINVALAKVLNRPDLDEARVRQIVDQLLHFDR